MLPSAKTATTGPSSEAIATALTATASVASTVPNCQVGTFRVRSVALLKATTARLPDGDRARAPIDAAAGKTELAIRSYPEGPYSLSVSPVAHRTRLGLPERAT